MNLKYMTQKTSSKKGRNVINLIEKICLQIGKKAYTKAHGVDSPNIEQMKKHYMTVGLQFNNKDCGFWVGRALQCHNGKDMVGNNKISIDLFRKEICYVLLYHAYNDLNPRRDGLVALLKAAALGSK